MGYSIYIGNAVISHTTEEDLKCDNNLSAWYYVPIIKLEEAPNFRGDEVTGKTNSRSPSYTAWSDFADNVGLRSFFFDEDTGLMRKHPGCFLIKKQHLDIVSKTLEEYKNNHPGDKPGTCNCKSCAGEYWKSDNLPHEAGYNYDLARLMWLEFWMKWALENCELPAICNT